MGQSKSRLELDLKLCSYVYVHKECASWAFSAHYGQHHYDVIIEGQLRYGDRMMIVEIEPTHHGNKYYLLQERTKLYTQAFIWELDNHTKLHKPFSFNQIWNDLNDDIQ